MFDSQKYWESKHKKYEDLNWINHSSIFSREAIKYFPQNGTVLELGAGQGQDSRFFVDHGYEVISTDFCDYALDKNRERAKQASCNYLIRKLDLSSGELPYNSNDFEVVYSNLSLHYFDDDITKKLFTEIWRILKKGGVFAMQVNSLDHKEVMDFQKIGEGLFIDSRGLVKRYFDLDYLRTIVFGRYQNILMDNDGKTSDFDHLIRFVGKKIDDSQEEDDVN